MMFWGRRRKEADEHDAVKAPVEGEASKLGKPRSKPKNVAFFKVYKFILFLSNLKEAGARGGRELMKHLSKEASKLGKLRKKLQAVEVWTRRRHVIVKLRRRIRSYYAEVWVRHEGAQRLGDPSTVV